MLNILIDNHYLSDYRYFKSELKSAVSEDRAVFVIVPEQYTFEAERDLLELLNAEALLTVEVLSLKRLVHRLIHNALNAEKPLSKLGKKMLISQIISDKKSELALYKEADSLVGLLDKLTDLIVEFRQQDIALEDINSLASELGDDSLLGRKLIELSLIYNAYITRLADNSYDEADEIKKAISILKHKTMFADTTIVIEAFSSMTKLEQELVFALAKQSDQLYLRLIGERKQKPIFTYSNQFVNLMINNAKNAGVNYKLEHNREKPTKFVQSFSSIFEYTPSEEQVIVMRRFQTITEEIEYLFMELMQHHINDSTAWREMAILTGDLTTYYPLLKRLAKDYQIPVFTDARRPASVHFVIDFILTTLKTINKGMRGRDVIKVLKTGFFSVEENTLFHCENIVIERGIKGKAWQDDWDNDEEFRQAMVPALNSLLNLKSSLAKAKLLADKIMVLKEFLAENHILEQIAEQSKELFNQGEYERAEELAQIYNVIDDVFYQLYLLDDKKVISNAKFYQILKIGFDNSEIGIIPNANDYVLCGNIKRTRTGKIKYLYLLGMTESALPSSQISAELFSDSECSLLKQRGFEYLTTSNDAYDEEVYKTYEHITKVSTNIYMSYASEDLLANPVKPSLWFTQLADLGNLEETTLSLGRLAEFGLEKALSKQIMKAFLNNQSLSSDDLARFKYLKNSLHSLDSFFDANIVNSILKIDGQLAKQIYGQDLALSVSRLERFANCPFQHFVNYGLKPIIRQEAELNPIDAGNLFHKVLEYSFNHLDILLNAENKLDSLIDKAVNEYITDKFRYRLNAQNAYYTKRLSQALNPALKALIKQYNSVEFKNYANEFAFRDFPLANGDMTVKGVIDRIDIAESAKGSYLQIIDYKSSDKRLDSLSIYHGLKLQLMLYLNVARKEISKKLAKKIQSYGAFYFNLSEPVLNDIKTADLIKEIDKHYHLDGFLVNDADVQKQLDTALAENKSSLVTALKVKNDGDLYKNRQLISAEEIDLLSDYAIYKASNLARDIYNGNCAVKPIRNGSQSACQYCDYRTICQFDSQKTSFAYTDLEKLEQEEIFKRIEKELDYGND